MFYKISIKSMCYLNTVAVLALLLPNFVLAAPQSTKLQPQQQTFVSLNSDQAECQQQQSGNICTYTGNASFTQNHSFLNAAEIIVYKNSNNEITKIIANGKGKLAHYKSIDDNNKLVTAEANMIKLYPDKNLMILIGQGLMTKEQNKVAGPYIEYNTKQKTIYSKPDKQNRTDITLFPDKQNA